MDTIGIIVPVYNVASWLRECLDSIVNQTYRNLKIILIDDASTDASGGICDEYLIDPRVTVIHKTQNEGLSCARNTGLDLIDTPYITFVDSDDYLAPSHIEDLYQNMREHQSDMAVCDTTYIGKKISTFYRHLTTECPPCITSREALLMLYEGTLKNTVWDKLYKTDLFKAIRFPAGKTYEDVHVMHPLLCRCKKISFTGKVGYYYRRRPGSITQTSGHTADYLDSIRLRQDRVTADTDLSPSQKEHCLQQLHFCCLRVLHEALYVNKSCQGDPELTAFWNTHRHQVPISNRKLWLLTRFPRFSVLLLKVKRAII